MKRVMFIILSLALILAFAIPALAQDGSCPPVFEQMSTGYGYAEKDRNDDGFVCYKSPPIPGLLTIVIDNSLPSSKSELCDQLDGLDFVASTGESIRFIQTFENTRFYDAENVTITVENGDNTNHAIVGNISGVGGQPIYKMILTLFDVQSGTIGSAAFTNLLDPGQENDFLLIIQNEPDGTGGPYNVRDGFVAISLSCS